MQRGPKAVRIRLTPPVRKKLTVLARSQTAPHRMVTRARIVLLAAQRMSNAAISRRVGCSVRCVSEWRNRFAAAPRLATLKDKDRCGRPARVPAPVRCELLKLACDRPEKERFQDIWTLQGLVDALVDLTGYRLSRSEVGRILRAEEIRPHRVRMWLHSPDPNFAPKVKRICALYTKPPPGATVVSVDEKPMQALDRKHATRHPGRGRSNVRFEYEYIRHGTRALIGAFNIATGEVLGRVYRRRSAKNLVSLMEQVAKWCPTGEVYVIWDNLNIHYDGKDKRWTRFNERHGGRFHFVYTPLHASWVNQIEIWFSILQRRVLQHGCFASGDDLADRVLDFIDHYNCCEAHPFRWTFRGHCRHNRRRQAA